MLYTAQGAGADVTSFIWTLPPGWAWGDDPDTFDATAVLIPPGNSAPFLLCVSALGSGCVGDPVCLQGEVSVGVVDPNGDAGYRVFPNPSEGAVHVVRAASGSAVLNVVDGLGHVVHQQLVQSPHSTLDLGHLGAGTYVLQWWEGARPHRLPVTLAR